MLTNTEALEVEKIIQERNISYKQLLEEKVAPLQEKISKHPGETIGAVARTYKSTNVGFFSHNLEEDLYTGIITPETRFPLEGSYFLLGVKNPHVLELNSSWERDFIKWGEDGNLGGLWIHPGALLYFMDRHPVVPEDSGLVQGCFGGSHRSFPVFPIEKPRLELYIGDEEALPFLQNTLEGWRYVQLAKLLERELPITDKVEEKILQEQLTIFDEIKAKESSLASLVLKRDSRLDLVKASGGEAVIPSSEGLELTDEFVENLHFGPLIKEGRSKILNLLQTAVKRNYHEIGRSVERQVDVGVSLKINMKEFFSHKKEEYKL